MEGRASIKELGLGLITNVLSGRRKRWRGTRHVAIGLGAKGDCEYADASKFGGIGDGLRGMAQG